MNPDQVADPVTVDIRNPGSGIRKTESLTHVRKHGKWDLLPVSASRHQHPQAIATRGGVQHIAHPVVVGIQRTASGILERPQRPTVKVAQADGGLPRRISAVNEAFKAVAVHFADEVCFAVRAVIRKMNRR